MDRLAVPYPTVITIKRTKSIQKAVATAAIHLLVLLKWSAQFDEFVSTHQDAKSSLLWLNNGLTSWLRRGKLLGPVAMITREMCQADSGIDFCGYNHRRYRRHAVSRPYIHFAKAKGAGTGDYI